MGAKKATGRTEPRAPACSEFLEGAHPRPAEFAAALKVVCLGLLKEYSARHPEQRRLRALLEGSDG